MLCEKGALRNFTKFTGKHLCQSLFFNKEACNFIKKETLAQVFCCEFCEISRNTFFIEHLCWLLLHWFYVFTFFGDVLKFWNRNILSFCVCHHCYHCVLQYVSLLENCFNSLLVIELLIYRNYLRERTRLNERPPSNQERGAYWEIYNVCRGAHSDRL